MTLCSGEPVQSDRFRIVLRNAPAPSISDAETELGLGVALVCGTAIPLRGLREILRHTQTSIVHHAEVEFGDSVALLRQGTNESDGGFVVAALVRRFGILQRPGIAGRYCGGQHRQRRER